MELYTLVVKATEEKDTAALWGLILRFDPYIKKECYSAELNGIDEDMRSEILSKLPHRISRFKIRCNQQSEK